MEQVWQETSREMIHRGFTQEQIAQAQVQSNERSVHDYESPEHTTNISVDEVCIKKQKTHRKPTTASVVEDSDDELKSPNLFTILRFILAFLLRNDLAQHRLRFYVDGQRTLQDGILTFFSWHRSVSLILERWLAI